VTSTGLEHDDINTQRQFDCPLCGWRSNRYIYLMKSTGLFDGIYSWSFMKTFSGESDGVSLYALEKSVPYDLDWDKIGEMLPVESRGLRCKQRILRQTFDGKGAMILLADGSREILIECLRDEESKSLRLKLVKTLVGPCIDWEGRKVRFLTTSGKPEAALIKRIEPESIELAFKFAEASELLGYLDVYQEDMPPLDKIDQRSRERIIRENSSS